jgi:macrophage erythroblast attacher
MQSGLRFELRLQQYIELVRKGETAEALSHAKKYLNGDKDWRMVQRAASLMIFSPNVRFEPVQVS